METLGSRTLDQIKSDFPIFRNRPHLAYLDAAATSHIPSTVLEEEIAFWSGDLGQRVLPPGGYAELTDLDRPDHLPLRLLLQEVGGSGPVTGHLDLAGAPDRQDVVARLEALGAERIEDFHHWTTMRAPDGRVFCVTDRQPGSA